MRPQNFVSGNLSPPDIQQWHMINKWEIIVAWKEKKEIKKSTVKIVNDKYNIISEKRS